MHTIRFCSDVGEKGGIRVRALLPLIFLLSELLASAQQPSLGDLARKSRTEKKSSAPKRILTNDEIGAPVGSAKAAMEASLEDAQRSLREIDRLKSDPGYLASKLGEFDKFSYARAILGAGLDLSFPGRPDWEERLNAQRLSCISALRDLAKSKTQYEQAKRALQNEVSISKGEEMKFAELQKQRDKDSDKVEKETAALHRVQEEGQNRAQEWKRGN